MRCGSQDGGAGSVGEVVGPAGGGWVDVRWLKSGESNSYRAGFNDQFDLALTVLTRYEKAMAGVANALVCSLCHARSATFASPTPTLVRPL